MKQKLSFAVLLFHFISLSRAVQYTWGNCPDAYWNGQTPGSCWSPEGIPGPKDDVIIPGGVTVVVTNKPGDSYPNTTYVYCPEVLLIQVNSIFVAKGANLTITDLVTLYISSVSIIDLGGYLGINAYIGALDGPGDLVALGTLQLLSGNIQGTGKIIVEPDATFNISSVWLSTVWPYKVRESYLMRNVTVNGVLNALPNSVIHAGFWWQRTNVTITINNGGVARFEGFFSKHFEQDTLSYTTYPHGSILVNEGGVLYLGAQEFFLVSLTNYGVIYSAYAPSNSSLSYYNFPYGIYFYNYGKSVVVPPSFESYTGVGNCEELRKYAEDSQGKDLTIFVNNFAKVGPLDCGMDVVISDATLRFVGSGGLIFAESVYLSNAVLEVDPGVDVVFIQQFHANDSRISVSDTSIVRLMYMPKEYPDGYHNYFDKSVLFWPTGEKKISFSGVTLDGGGGTDFLSEVNLEGGGLALKDGEVYFLREYGATAISGSGDFVVLNDGFVSFGIKSCLNGTGKIEVFGKAEVPEIAHIASERQFIFHEGSAFNTEGIFVGREMNTQVL